MKDYPEFTDRADWANWMTINCGAKYFKKSGEDMTAYDSDRCSIGDWCHSTKRYSLYFNSGIPEF